MHSSPVSSSPVDLARTYWRATVGHHRRIITSLVLLLVGGVLEAAAIGALIPLLSSGARYEIFGLVLEGSDLRWASVAGFGAAGTLAAVAKFAGERSIIRFVAQFEEALRKRMMGLLMNMDWSAFLSMRLGDINTSTFLTVARVANGSQYFVRAAGALLVSVAFAAFAAVISPWMTLFTLAFGVIAALAYRASSRRAERHAQTLTESARAIGAEIADTFGNLKFFRSSGHVPASKARIDGVVGDFADAYYRSQVVAPRMRSAFETASILFMTVVLVISLALEDGFSPGSLAFLAIFFRLAPRLQQAQEYLQMAQVERPWLTALTGQVATAAAAQDHPSQGEAPTFSQSLRAEDVGFTFASATIPTLANISWSLERGECLAFVGESGSGKTTMLDLVTGLLVPTSGRITVDGRDLTSIDREAWQSRLSIVMQESPMFHASVLENVRWLEPEIDREKAVRCLEMAHARTFVDALPHGIDTVIGEKGGKLSGGQRQRLALARALYRDPWLLILDEATSALDGESEAAVQRALEQIKGNCSMIIVAHRLRTVTLADRICILEQGRLIEEGTWDDLMVKDSGAFAAMARAQQVSTGHA